MAPFMREEPEVKEFSFNYPEVKVCIGHFTIAGWHSFDNILEGFNNDMMKS